VGALWVWRGPGARRAQAAGRGWAARCRLGGARGWIDRAGRRGARRCARGQSATGGRRSAAVGRLVDRATAAASGPTSIVAARGASHMHRALLLVGPASIPTHGGG